MKIFACAAALLVIALSGCAADSTDPTTNKGMDQTRPISERLAAVTSYGLEATLTDSSISLNSPMIGAGKVRITAVNAGSVVHELVVIKTDKKADALGQKMRVSEAGSVGEIADLAAGKSASKTFVLAPGHYALICNIDGHYMMGMHVDLVVK